MQTPTPPPGATCQRRLVLLGGASLATFPAFSTRADDTADDPASMLAQPGDRFVYLGGDSNGQVIKAADLPVGGPQVQAYPMDPKSGVVRDGSPLNLVILARFNPADLKEETRAISGEGVVAYTAVCTHQGCPVNMWEKDAGALFCSCHGSQYDPKDGAEVVAGPAPRALPALPIKIEDGVPVAAGAFSGRVGAEQS
jgi:rieske iron-sulfur protein